MNVAFIHGPAAAGKHTVGALVAETLGWPLFHNHLTVDLVTALFPFGTPGFSALRDRVWLAAFEEAARAGTSFVFTFHPEATVAPDLPRRLQQHVESRGGQVHFVALECDRDTALQRLDEASRARFGKLRDKTLYREIEAAGGFEFAPLPPPLLSVDTARVEPADAAARICDAIHGAMGRD